MYMKNRIKIVRAERRISQQKLADLVGTGRSTIVKLERSERRLNTDWMDRIAKALNCMPADLLPLGDDIDHESTPIAIPTNNVPVSRLVQELCELDLRCIRPIREAIAGDEGATATLIELDRQASILRHELRQRVEAE